MRTIKKILEYNLTTSEKEALLLAEIINGCGGKGGTNFDKILKSNLSLVPGYNPKKGKILLKDLKEICFEHDIDYRFQKGFYKANYKFAKKIYLLFRGLKKIKWISRKQAFTICLIAFVLLNKYGKKFYYIKK